MQHAPDDVWMMVSDLSMSTALARVDRHRWQLLRHRVVRTYLNVAKDVEDLDAWLTSPTVVSAALFIVARSELAGEDGSALELPTRILTPALQCLAVNVQQDRHRDASDDLTLVPRLACWLGEATNDLSALRSLSLELSDCMGFNINGLLFAVGTLSTLQHLALSLSETGTQGCPAIFPTLSSIVQFRGHLFPQQLRSLRLDLPLVQRYPVPSDGFVLMLVDCLANSDWSFLRDFRLGLRGHHLGSNAGASLARLLRALPRVHRWELDLADNNLCADGVADFFAGGWPPGGDPVMWRHVALNLESNRLMGGGLGALRAAMKHATNHAALPDLGVLELRLGFNHLGNVGVMELVGGLENLPPSPGSATLDEGIPAARATTYPWDASLAAQWTAQATTDLAPDWRGNAEWLTPGVHTLLLDLRHNLITSHDAIDALGLSVGHHAAMRDLSLYLGGNLLRSLTGLMHLRPRLRRLRLEVDYDPSVTLPRRMVPVQKHATDLHTLLLGLPLLRELYLAGPPELVLALDSVRFLTHCVRLHWHVGFSRIAAVDPVRRRLWRDHA